MKETAYLLQAAIISAWWMGLAFSSRFFDAFQFDGIPPTAFWSFFAPDMFLIGVLSAFRAYRKIEAVEYIVLGAFGYGALFCCNATILTASGYLSTGLMVVGMCYNVFLCFNKACFRRSSSGLLWNCSKTFVQVVCIWLLALVVIPFAILDAFDSEMAVPMSLQTVIGIGLFLGFSTLGLTSAYYMVRDGDGTPLPLDQTNQLVISGPYRFVRNPMAVAGVGQVVAVAIVFQSVPILIYSVLGAVVWHLVVKPIEEQDMLVRFGEPYRLYQNQVSCWLPTFRANVRDSKLTP